MATHSLSPSAVSVVIPTYNARHLLQKNLPSVFKALRDQDEVVIVDDASTDETLAWLRSEFKLQLEKKTTEYEVFRSSSLSSRSHVDISVIRNIQNVRFGASVNRGVNQTKHNLIFLINNDVIPHADVLQYLLPHFEDPLMFAVGCLEHEGKQLSGKNKLWFERGLFLHSRADNFLSGETAWASGGSAMFDKAKWAELGGFDARYYPAYWEDVDLSTRAKQKGWKVWFEEQAEVDHLHESTNQDVFGQQKITRMSWQNAKKFTWRHASWWQRVLFLIWQPYHHFKLRASLGGIR